MDSQRAYFLHLLKSALNGTVPEEKPGNVSFPELFYTSVNQKLASAIFCAVDKLKSKPDAEIYTKWQKIFIEETLKGDRMTEEAHELEKILSNGGVDVMLLKGCVMKPLYPEPAFRSMSDIDLMYRADDSLLRLVLAQNGYKAKQLDEVCHDVFIKSRYTRIEAHRKLFKENSPYYPLFAEVMSRAIQDSEYPHVYRMSYEDAYLHIICHAAKHYESSGIGLRVLCDFYVMSKTIKNLDNDYIEKMLASVGLTKFRKTIETVADIWLGDGTGDVPKIIENEFFLGTVYGDNNSAALRDISKRSTDGKGSKVGYFLRRIFLPIQTMKYIYPVLKKHPWLYPFCVIERCFNKLFCDRKRFRTVNENLASVNKEKIENQKLAFEMFGILRQDEP